MFLSKFVGHDGGVIPNANALFSLNDALNHSAVFVQVRIYFTHFSSIFLIIILHVIGLWNQG